MAAVGFASATGLRGEGKVWFGKRLPPLNLKQRVSKGGER